jgi:hypothetical protein
MVRDRVDSISTISHKLQEPIKLYGTVKNRVRNTTNHLPSQKSDVGTVRDPPSSRHIRDLLPVLIKQPLSDVSAL